MIMALPAIKALASMGHEVDVLVGTGPDDVGAWDVVYEAHRNMLCGIATPWCNRAQGHYDLAIASIPFDGRWRNGIDFSAKGVIDGRTRPDPSTQGLVSWKKHEVEYQMDNVRSLGYKGEIPDCSFFRPVEKFHKQIYLGVGYKKDQAGFWKVKHWGNENYVNLVGKLLKEDPTLSVITTGDTGDLQFSLIPIARELFEKFGGAVRNRFRIYPAPDLQTAFQIVASCGTYVGNDTGMMHVAASAGCNVVAVFNLENSVVKSRPWCLEKNRRCLEGWKDPVTVDQFYQASKEFLG